jgi:phosphate transport system substrate-binding protein
VNKQYFARSVLLFLIVIFIGNATVQAAATEDKKPVTHKAPAKAAPAPPIDAIVLRGDHSTARALKDLIKQYELGKQGKITLQPFSTVSGLDAVSAGTADLAGTARAAMPDRAEEKGINFYPVAWDAVVPIVAFDNPVSNITLKQLHDLYLGRINNWKDLGGPDSPINLYAIAPPLDGVEYSARLLLFHFGDQAVAAPRLYVNTEKLEEGITIDPHGMGLSTFSGVMTNPKVKMLTVEGARASLATIADGSYPMYSALYLASRDDGKQHEAVEKFIAFSGSDTAKEILRKDGLVPYGDVPNLMEKQAMRTAFVDSRVFGSALPAATVAVTSATPVSAPNATAQSLQRIAPTSERTIEAKDRAVRANAEKADGTGN